MESRRRQGEDREVSWIMYLELRLSWRSSHVIIGCIFGWFFVYVGGASASLLRVTAFDLVTVGFFFFLFFGAVGMITGVYSSSMGSPGPDHSGSLPMAYLDSFDSEAQIIQ